MSEPKTVTCPDCEGFGYAEDNEEEDCETCGGSGVIEEPDEGEPA